MLLTDPLLVDRLTGLATQWLYKMLINVRRLVRACEKKHFADANLHERMLVLYHTAARSMQRLIIVTYRQADIWYWYVVLGELLFTFGQCAKG